MTPCGCVAAIDRNAWHRYRGSAPCDEARASGRAYDREKYARRVAREGGRPIKQTGRRRKDQWIPGTPISLTEEDPL